MVDPISIGFGSNRWLKDSDTQFLSLFRATNGTGWYSLHSYLNVDYLVPVGKKFIILGNGFKTATMSIGYDTVADNSGTTVYSGMEPSTSASHMWAEIPASNYISVYVNATANAEGSLWGIETTT